MLHGHSLIGAFYGQSSGHTFQAVDPSVGEALEPVYHRASPKEIEQAIMLAHESFDALEITPGQMRAALLYRIANELEAVKRPLLERAARESALPPARLESEFARTCLQLCTFAALAERSGWTESVIHHGDVHRLPQPRPDLRAVKRGLGVVVVFASSAFPLAFGVAGSDTASALAAGCPVIVKAHPLHPGTSEIVGRAIQSALMQCGLPAGAFSLIFDGGHESARALVMHPNVRAIGFTGSQRAGRVILELVQSRAVPIPVYAQMGGINPVFVLPHALARHGAEIGHAVAHAMTQSVGQLSTSPRTIVAQNGPGFVALRESLRAHVDAAGPSPMLSAAMARDYNEGLARWGRHPNVRISPRLTTTVDRVLPCIGETDARSFGDDASLREEVFGPASLVVQCANPNDVLACADALEGQLTASIWLEPNDDPLARELARRLQRKVGRLVFNGVPNAIEVSPAMVHGGPFPATSDGRSTAVGAHAVDRWTRLVCYQNAPITVLPFEALDEHSLVGRNQK